MHSENSSTVPQAILEFLGSPFRTIKYFFRDLSKVDERLEDRSIIVRLLAFATIPLQLLGGFLSLMLQNWPTSRSGIAAIASIPAFFTLLSLLGAWVVADYVRSDTKRIGANQAYYNFNVANFPDAPESALAFAKKLVDIDPEDIDLKFQLGRAHFSAGNPFLANDIMKSIAPDDDEGYLNAHVWRANYVVKDKSPEELKVAIGLAQKHLKTAMALDPESLSGKARLANLYMSYANNLQNDQSAERLDYLVKADEKYREIIEDKSSNRDNSSVQISTLPASVLARKQLEAIDPETYSVETEINRVTNSINSLLKVAIRFNPDSLQLWLLLINAASEIRQFDLAVDIADQGIKHTGSQETAVGLVKAKSLVLRKAALSINKFDDYNSYKNRFVYLCEAVRAAPQEGANYVLLLQFIGNENEKPTIQVARKLGLAEPGDAVPINLDWLHQTCVETKYTGFLCTLIGLHEFHLGNTEAALKNWNVAQQFDPLTRDFISKLFEVLLYAKLDKLDNFETMLSKSLLIYPEASRIRLLRGTYYTNEKKFQAAIDDFRALLTSNPQELLLHHKIKSCYEFMGQRRAAEEEQNILNTKIAGLPQEKQLQLQEILRRLEKQDNSPSAAATNTSPQP